MSFQPTSPWRPQPAGSPCWAGRPGCYVYSYGYQAPLPALQQAALEVREQYNILYSEFYDGLTLTFEN